MAKAGKAKAKAKAKSKSKSEPRAKSEPKSESKSESVAATQPAAAAKRPSAKRPAKQPGKASAEIVGGELLAQILGDPQDHALRIVYADALSDAGDPRGAFIAQQCALAELDPLDARYAPLLASTNRLIAAHGKQWLGDVGSALSAGGVVDRVATAVFEAGFVKRIAMQPEDIATQWPKLRAREPVQGIELIVDEWLAHAYRTLAEPRQFEVLKVTPTGWFTGDSFANVLAWGMPALRELDIAGCDVGIAGAQMIANQPTDLGAHFPDHVAPPPFAHGQLRALGLFGTNIGDAGARLVLAAPHLAGLAALDLGRCGLAAGDTLGALRDAETMHGLRRLSLAGNNALGAGLGVLAGWAERLVELKLPQATTADALHALFPRPSPTLRTLELASAKDLAGARIADVAEALAHLDIGTTSLGDDRFIALVGAPSMRRLVHLHANGCSLSDAAVTELPLERLVSLDVSSNKLTDAGMTALARWAGLSTVTFLRIGNNRKVTAAGLEALANAPHFQPVAFDIGKLAAPALVARLRERFGAALVARD